MADERIAIFVANPGKRKGAKMATKKRKRAKRKKNPATTKKNPVATKRANPRRRRRARKNPASPSGISLASKKNPRRRRRSKKNPSSVLMKTALAAGGAALLVNVVGSVANKYTTPMVAQGVMSLVAVGAAAFSEKDPIIATAVASAFASPVVAQYVGPAIEKALGPARAPMAGLPEGYIPRMSGVAATMQGVAATMQGVEATMQGFANQWDGYSDYS